MSSFVYRFIFTITTQLVGSTYPVVVNLDVTKRLDAAKTFGQRQGDRMGASDVGGFEDSVAVYGGGELVIPGGHKNGKAIFT